jgi:hypothetical protein
MDIGDLAATGQATAEFERGAVAFLTRRSA